MSWNGDVVSNNENDGDTSAIPPRKLTPVETSTLRSILYRELVPHVEGSTYEEEQVEDASDLLDYAFAMLGNVKSVNYIVKELISMEMEICDVDTARRLEAKMQTFLEALPTNDNNEEKEEQEEGDQSGGIEEREKVVDDKDNSIGGSGGKIITLKSNKKANALTMSGALGASRHGEKPQQKQKNRVETKESFKIEHSRVPKNSKSGNGGINKDNENQNKRKTTVPDRQSLPKGGEGRGRLQQDRRPGGSVRGDWNNKQDVNGGSGRGGRGRDSNLGSKIDRPTRSVVSDAFSRLAGETNVRYPQSRGSREGRDVGDRRGNGGVGSNVDPISHENVGGGRQTIARGGSREPPSVAGRGGIRDGRGGGGTRDGRGGGVTRDGRGGGVTRDGRGGGVTRDGHGGRGGGERINSLRGRAGRGVPGRGSEGGGRTRSPSPNTVSGQRRVRVDTEEEFVLAQNDSRVFRGPGGRGLDRGGSSHPGNNGRTGRREDGIVREGRGDGGNDRGGRGRGPKPEVFANKKARYDEILPDSGVATGVNVNDWEDNQDYHDGGYYDKYARLEGGYDPGYYDDDYYDPPYQHHSDTWHGDYYSRGGGRGQGGGRGRGFSVRSDGFDQSNPNATRTEGIANEATLAAAEASPSPLVAATFGAQMSYGGHDGYPRRGRGRGRGRGFPGRTDVAAILASKSWTRPKPQEDGGEG